MKAYTKMNKEELLQLQKDLGEKYQEAKAMNLSLDMSRGKPALAQLDLSMPMMNILNENSVLKAEDGTDCRNYGTLDGIPEAKELMAQMMDAKPENTIVYGNSSLNIMYDTVARSIIHGVNGNTPWCKLDTVKFLCPSPGYDRHFAITESFGIEMIPVPMHEDGPDMDMVEEYVNKDESIKGIWCIPKYSNPQGYTYSDEVVKRFANLKPAAKDFRIFWDNAYCVHHIYEDKQDSLLNIMDECEKAGNENMVYQFGSTSKVTFAGSGISAIATSKQNLEEIKKHLTLQTIGHDKVNQLRHAKFLKNKKGIEEHMMKHAAIVRPKFAAVLEVLERELGEAKIASWTNPKGGYFISFETLEGCAKKVVAKCKEAGVVMTGAGATFPYGKDPKDSNIRIAPTLPTSEELAKATDLFVLCVKLVSVEKLLENA